MEKPDTPNRSKVLICLFGGVMFAVLSIVTSRLTSYSTRMSNILYQIDLTWVFWLMVICAVACLVPPLASALGTIHEKHGSPRFLAVFFGDQFKSWRDSIITRLGQMLRGEPGYLVAVGVAIFIIVTVLSNTYFVRDRETGAFLNEFVSDLIRPHPPQLPAPTAVQLGLFTSTSDFSDYLRYCSRIVKDLESIGVKAVLVDIREASRYRGGNKHNLIEELAKSKIVVLGLNNYWEFQGTPLPRSVYTFRPFESYLSPQLNRIRPAADALQFPETPLDVSLEMLRRIKDYPVTMKPRQEGSVLVFGDYRIPVTKDGWMYSRPVDPYGYITSGLGAQIGIRSDTLIYYYKTETYSDLSKLRDQIGSKVFFISWESNHSWRVRMEDFYAMQAITNSLNNILRGNVIRKVELNPLWLVILCLVASGFIARKFRPLVSVLMILLFGVLILATDSMLYDRANLLIEITYPLLSILMAMVIFPSLSLVHRLRQS